MDTERARDAALAFLKSRRTGVLATLSKEDEPRARLVYYATDDAFNVYFLTLANTRKAADLAAHPKAAFVVSDDAVPRTLQMEGDAADITNSPADDAVIEALFDRLQMNAEYYAPLARFDRADVRFYRLSPAWVRFGDFTEGRSTAEVLFEVAP